METKAHNILTNQISPMEDNSDRRIAFKKLWTNFAPRCAQVIVRKALKCRLPTKDNLILRGMTHLIATPCVFCVETEETTEHIFFNCKFARDIWARYHRWLHITTVQHQVSLQNFLINSMLFDSKKLTRIGNTLWIGII